MKFICAHVILYSNAPVHSLTFGQGIPEMPFLSSNARPHRCSFARILQKSLSAWNRNIRWYCDYGRAGYHSILCDRAQAAANFGND